jgi:Pterin binding enzyme
MFTLNCKGKLWRLDSPQVMGILNATPDSFYQGQLAEGIAGMTQRAVAMAAAGATIVDIGGQSTRPGSEVVSVATGSFLSSVVSGNNYPNSCCLLILTTVRWPPKP